MPALFFKVENPADISSVTLALEAGIDGLLAPPEALEELSHLARCEVRAHLPSLLLQSKDDEESVARCLAAGENMVLAHGWEILPVENLLAHPNPQVSSRVLVEVTNMAEARLALGILERGVSGLVILPAALPDLKAIVDHARYIQPPTPLQRARLTHIRPVGLGHRVCIDTLSLLQRGQGLLVGNSSAFTFLVHAETEHNAYVAARPFRVNAGAVHAYALLPDDRTRYLEEIKSGDEVLIVDAAGQGRTVTVGRVKVEARPMLLLEAETESGQKGAVFLQNAETICLVRPDGSPISVVQLHEGDEILCHTDSAGRHFGMRVTEDISEH